MKTFLADTNIFIRFFTADDKRKAKSVLNTLKKVEAKKVELIITEAVFIEIIHILSSKKLYSLPRNQVKKLILSILILDNIKMANKKFYLQALDYYESKNIDITDCILAVTSIQSNNTGVYSFDTDFDKIEDIARVEKI
ncbi:MAG: PIN domain-containing protein [Patescibacteria group bacterium]